MFVRSSDFDPTLTQSNVDDIINSLAVNAYDFSGIACLDGRMYGVTTKCEKCNLEINYCVRNELSRTLHATQQLTERELGYALSTQYHRYRAPFGFGGKLRLPHRNIEAVNVIQGYKVIEGYDSITVSPYIQEDIDLQLIDGKCFAVVSASLVENPSKAIIRDDTGKLYEHQEVVGYPKRSSGNWLIPIMGITSPCTSDRTFNVQHCELVRVQVTTPECNGMVRPVYPNTHQIIPTFKIEKVGNNTVFWFHVWVLARPEFMDDGINFATGDFYKLFDTLDVMCFTDEVKNAVVTVMERDECKWVYTDSKAAPAITILNAETGLIEIDSNLFTCNNCDWHLPQCPKEYPKYIEIWYKVNPLVSSRPFHITAIKNAIAYYAGAELPTSACQCTVSEGFIFEAQSSFIKKQVNPFTGEVVTNMEYRDMYGRVRHREILSGIPKSKQAGVI